MTTPKPARHEDVPETTVSIRVDYPVNQLIKIDPGPWLVSDLKEKVGVPAHKVLARIDPFGLTALGDDDIVDVEDGMRFMSHVRPGASS